MKLKPAGELNYQTLHSSWIFVSTWDGIALNTRHLVNETLCFQKGSSVLLIRLNVLDSNLLLFHVNTEKILNLSVNWINSGSASSFFFFVHPPDINECESQPCLNGGECVDKVANFTCICPAAFTGPLCETGDSNCAWCWRSPNILLFAFLFGFRSCRIFPSGTSTRRVLSNLFESKASVYGCEL